MKHIWKIIETYLKHIWKIFAKREKTRAKLKKKKTAIFDVFYIFSSFAKIANLQFPGTTSGKAGKLQKTIGNLRKKNEK